MIHVVKNWYIEADKYQYTLFQLVKKKDKPDVEQKINYSHHTSMSSCLTHLIRLTHRHKVAKYDMTLQEAIESFQKIENIVIKSVEGEKI